MIEIGTVVSLGKGREGRYWCVIHYGGNVRSEQRISIKELAWLRIDDSIKIETKWNEGGCGQTVKIVRPIVRVIQRRNRVDVMPATPAPGVPQ